MKTNSSKALVVGAGISGIRSALDLAESGHQVILIDRSLHMGGILSRLDYQFPTNHCGMCKMLPLVERDSGSQFCLRKGLFHDNIELRLGCELTSVSGKPGEFSVTLRQAPTQVDPDLCTGCGICSQVCPVEVPDDFNAGLATRKAIYLPLPHAVPNPYVIDPAACDHCGKCLQVCPTGAINLSDQQRGNFLILVVDDEPAVRDSLKEWLVDEGFAVDMAESGRQALEMLRDKDYGLMLTDIKMPGMDGVELLQRAKQVRPELTVVMMTAYATVETAVEAMKEGAFDYLMKPFDPARMIPMVVRIFEDRMAARDLEIGVGAIVLACGTDYFNPAESKNTLGYGICPHVITGIEFERLVSGTGPTAGRLVRPADGKPARKIAWLQCVGSRDLQTNTDYCSSVCCMYAVKEALLAGEKAGEDVETAIFYMDMRAFGLPFQRYLDEAAARPGMRFERTRVHSVTPHPESGSPVLTYMGTDGKLVDETFDLVVLSVGQRPARRTEQLAEMTGCKLNQWGFPATAPLDPVSTDRPGIFVSGSASGLKDISESVIFASAAAARAAVAMGGGDGSSETDDKETAYRDVSGRRPKIMAIVCTCGQRLSTDRDGPLVEKRLKTDPAVGEVVFVDRLCTAGGWQKAQEAAAAKDFNRILVGACHPYLFVKKIKALSAAIRLAPHLIDAVDLGLTGPDSSPPAPALPVARLQAGLARLKAAVVDRLPEVEVAATALVVGGGVAGMQAALTMAERGHRVTLVEKSDRLGGNLDWLQTTIDGQDLQDLCRTMVSEVESHPNIKTMTGSGIVGGYGQVGSFFTTIRGPDGEISTLEHGVAILATGGREATTTAYGYGSSDRIITQRRLEQALADTSIKPAGLETVVMIQCVDSRRKPRNYCSRVCCPTTIKHCLKIKQQNPETAVYVLYRDIMTPGFMETYFTAARRAGVIFIPYDPENRPEVEVADGEKGAESVKVNCTDPVSGLKLTIETDLLVLATGIVPRLPAELAATFGVDVDEHGFFRPADSKWRPVDALKEGVFACGICLGPRAAVESMATGQAAASRALRIISRRRISSGHPVARVRYSLCALCERCIEACPYRARMLDTDRTKVVVNTAMCQGCGTCAAVCPNGASVINGYLRQQMFETIDALTQAFDEPLDLEAGKV